MRDKTTIELFSLVEDGIGLDPQDKPPTLSERADALVALSELKRRFVNAGIKAGDKR